MKSSYETTAGRSYAVKALGPALAVAQASGELEQLKTATGQELKNVYLVTPYSKEISTFHHPIQTKDARDRTFLVVDQRPNLVAVPGGGVKIRQPGDYNFLTLRASLEALWLQDYAMDFLNLGAIPMRAFSRWLGEGITRRLGLPAQDQLTVQIVTAYYYVCQFQIGPDAIPFTEDDYLRITTRIRNYLGAPVELVLGIINNLPILKDLSDYCAALQDAVPNARMHSVNPAFVISACSGGWFGPNNREVMAVAMEFPPAFLAIVYTAITDRSMHSSAMSKFIATVARGKDSDQFVKSLKAYLENLHDV